jgi:C4-dicarboxylate-specific signal transduction histidine kinase
MAIEQILMHLLSNSRDALARLPAGAPRIVRITAVREEGADGARCVRITVADSGPGLEAEVLARLFEPFVTTKGPERGTGLGLSTCLALARDMGSAIEGGNGAQGAVFSLILPEAQPH